MLTMLCVILLLLVVNFTYVNPMQRQWTRLYKLEESDSRPESRLKSRKFKVSWLPPQEATKGEPVVDEDPKSHQKDGSDMSGRPEAAQTVGYRNVSSPMNRN